MEKQITNIYYITTDVSLNDNRDNGRKKKIFSFFHRKKEKLLPVYKCGKSYLYAQGRPSVAGKPVASGEVQIWFSILPENVESELRKESSLKKWQSRIGKAMDYAQTALGCRDTDHILLSEKLCRSFDRDQSIPEEIYGIFLWARKKKKNFSHFLISLPEEYGFLLTESVKALTEPYLAGVNGVTFAGRETEQTQELEDFFYEEYGIVAQYGKCICEDSVHLDFVHEGEMLKFLDTAVKSGYNTKVN